MSYLFFNVLTIILIFFSLAICKFSNQPDNQQFLVVGIAKDYQLNPKQISGGYLNTYKSVS